MIIEIKEKWPEILETIKSEHEISDVSFKTWLQPLIPYDTHANVLFLLLPDERMGQNYINYIDKKYTVPLKVAVAECTGLELDIQFIFPSQTSDIDRLVNSSSNVTNAKPIVSVSAPSDETFEKAGLNRKYTFDTYVVGDNNSFAHAAAVAVAESPAEIYNPLFIYGGVGLGKTHIMQSIGNYILTKDPNKKVMYVTSEAFTNELVESIKNDRTNTNQKFRDKYRKVDVLLIDDIQFIAGKESTQEEFFHTFNALRESKKQIVISSDRPPKDIATLEDRLRSRFEWGLTVDIAPPSYETRMAILRKKAEFENLNVPNEILEYIANNIKSNIRELEGSLTKLTAYAKFTHNDLSIALAEEALRDIIFPNETRDVTPDLIIKTVSDHFNITPADITSHKRNKEIVYPRQIAMYLCRAMTDVPLATIGKLIGNRDHTTVIHGADKISDAIKNNEQTKELIDILIKKINPS